MKIPVVCGTIDRRMLVNFRVASEVLQRILPAPFRVKVIRGCGIAGICLIRLKQMRVRFAPAAFGVTSENAAHRIAVEWEDDGVLREGVFIPRRDTSSKLNAFVGGRIFPGVHQLANFDVREDESEFHLQMRSEDGVTRVRVDAQLAGRLPETSLFKSLSEASQFFERGSLGYSVTAARGKFDGLELKSFRWDVEPLSGEPRGIEFLQRFPTFSGRLDRVRQCLVDAWDRT
ncbi:MAG: DUF2071 domain-containing protein [Verrucomicrobiota bacterium]